MKKYIYIVFLVAFFTANAFSVEKVSLKNITNKVLEQNLLVLQNAEKVYQAKASINEARLNMLPKLNLWTLGKVAIDPTSFLDVAQEIAPFLVPANWFRMKETEKLFQAERFGMLSLQANEVYQARAILFNLMIDLKLLRSLEKYEAEMFDLVSIAEDRYDLGLEKIEIVRQAKIQHINLVEDVSNMRQLIDFEKSTLMGSISLPPDTEVEIEEIENYFFQIEPINPKDWENAMLQASPELKQFDKFIELIPLIKNEVRFSVLGVPSISRGTGGGIFDDLPVSTGLGFSTGKQLQIVESKKHILELQRKGVEDTLKRQLFNLATEYNSNIKMHNLQSERLVLSEENFNTIKEKLTLGGDVALSDLNQSIELLIQSYATYVKTAQGFGSLKDKLSRLTFTSDYAQINKNFNGQEQRLPEDCRKTIFGRKKCK